MKELRNFVAGEWCGSAHTWEKHSPFDGRAVARVHEATPEMIDRAVEAGAKVAEGDWGRAPVRERVRAVRALADALMARVDDLIEADVADTGRPYWQARNFDGARAINVFYEYCDLALSLEDRAKSFQTRDGFRGLWLTQRRPKGVVACIAPWNVPMLMMALKVAPALVMGNAAIAKPSEETPSSATILAEVVAASDIPAGAFSLLHGFGRDSTGERLVAHPGVKAVTFTGEPSTGSTIMRSAAVGLREVAMELGGKNAALVFDDADMDATIEGMTRAAFFNAGQICFCTERVYVHRSRYREFLDRISAVAGSIVLGEPRHEGFSIGPLISRKHRDKVMSLVASVEACGGTIVSGGAIPAFGDARDDGAFLQPTVATGLFCDAPAMRKETFGPFVHVAPFDDEDEAIALANDCDYGLGAVIWSNGLDRCLRVAPRLRVGHVWANAWQTRDLQSPLSGAGISGIGQQFGISSLEFCSQPLTMTIRIRD